jgi:hypothetical protein
MFVVSPEALAVCRMGTRPSAKLFGASTRRGQTLYWQSRRQAEQMGSDKMMQLFPGWIFRGLALGLYFYLIVWIVSGLRKERWSAISWTLGGGVLSGVLMTFVMAIWWVAL